MFLSLISLLPGHVSSESETVMVGGLDNIGADAFDLFDYVALGHLHRAQKVKRETIRYCGTLFPYSFDKNEGGKIQ
jgi:DNA repair exonuclease